MNHDIDYDDFFEAEMAALNELAREYSGDRRVRGFGVTNPEFVRMAWDAEDRSPLAYRNGDWVLEQSSDAIEVLFHRQNQTMKGRPSMRKALVQFYEKDGQRAIRTNADNAHDFLLSAALQLDIVLPSRGDTSRADMLADWLPQITEIAAKLKGYKADVYEERVIIAGRWRPDADSEVPSPEEVLGVD